MVSCTCFLNLVPFLNKSSHSHACEGMYTHLLLPHTYTLHGLCTRTLLHVRMHSPPSPYTLPLAVEKEAHEAPEEEAQKDASAFQVDCARGGVRRRSGESVVME